MVAILITALLTFVVISLFGYVVHWALHQEWAGRFNNAHMTHHITLYPPSDYTSDTYRHAGKDNTTWTFAGASLPLIVSPIVLWALGILPLSLMITILLVEGLMGFLNIYLHDAFHTRNHFLNRIPLIRVIFGHWNKLHYLHHVDMQKNFGIFLFSWDRLFKTFWRDKLT